MDELGRELGKYIINDICNLVLGYYFLEECQYSFCEFGEEGIFVKIETIHREKLEYILRWFEKKIAKMRKNLCYDEEITGYYPRYNKKYLEDIMFGACRGGSLKILKFCISKKVLNSHNGLTEASSCGHMHIVDYYLENFKKTDLPFSNSLKASHNNGHFDIYSKLLENKPKYRIGF